MVPSPTRVTFPGQVPQQAPTVPIRHRHGTQPLWRLRTLPATAPCSDSSFLNFSPLIMFYSLSQQKKKSEFGGYKEFLPPQAARQHCWCLRSLFPPHSFWGKCLFSPTLDPALAAHAGRIHSAVLSELWHTHSPSVTISLSDDGLFHFSPFPLKPSFG